MIRAPVGNRLITGSALLYPAEPHLNLLIVGGDG